MSSNMFACLGDSDDESPKAVNKAPKQKDAPAPAAKDASKKPAAPAPAAAPAAAAASKPKAAKESKGDSKPKEERPKSANHKRETPAGEGEDRVAKDDNRGGRPGRGHERNLRHGEPRREGGRGEGRGEGRREPREGGEERPRKREFDRRSGTGRSGEQRRGGRGPHSLGNVEQEALDAEKHRESADPEVEVEEVAEAAEAVPAEPQAPPTLSFDEYMAKRNEARANTEIFGSCKTREVEADFTGLKVAAEENLEVVGCMHGTRVRKPVKNGNQRSSTATKLLELGFKTGPTESQDDDGFRGGRGRGEGRGEGRSGRGGEREGRGGRGEGRGEGRGGRGGRGRPHSAGGQVNINDSASFPSL